MSKKHDNAYNLFAPRTDPITNTSCHIISSHTLNLIPSIINATPTTDINFVSGGVLLNGSNVFTTSAYKTTFICGENNIFHSIVSNVSEVRPIKSALFTVSPNPATTIVHFTIPFSDKLSTLIIYNGKGEKVFTQQLSAGITSKDIDISMLAPGIYNSVFIRDDSRTSLKIIKN